MKKLLELFFKFDYDILGEYFDAVGNGHYKKKYIKRHKFKRKAEKKWHYLPIR